MYHQHWTAKKILYYGVYRIIAKHVPEDIPLIGQVFRSLRRFLCRPLFKEAPDIFNIGKGVDFDNGCNVILKDYSNIGDYALLSGNHATITIGRHVMMGRYCIIICQNHKFQKEGYLGYEGKDVVIDDYAWLGHRVIVLPGVHIGQHAIVGAGAVVTKSVPDYSVVAGNPARIVKYRI